MSIHHTHTQRHPPHGIRVHAREKDPTRTTGLRARYEQDFNRRFSKFKKLVVAAVRDHNILALRTNAVPTARFDFAMDTTKVSQFMTWLNGESNKIILGARSGTAQTSAAAAWQNVYLDTAYQKGLAQAASELRGAGVRVASTWADSAFYRPVHADRVGIIYTRAYDALKGVTTEMGTQVGATLAQGLAEGRSPEAISKMLTDRIDKVGRTRARLIARTEVINAHATASLNAYREAGVEGVGVHAEFSTAGDDAVCPECEDLEGQVYTLDEAEGVIPVHPNCRCAWLPVVDDPSNLSLGEGPDQASVDTAGEDTDNG